MDKKIIDKNLLAKRIGQVLLVTLALYLIETLSYFYIAEYFGKLFGINNTLNLQLPVDKLLPWFTPLFIVYIPWPFIWFFVIPLVIYYANGSPGYYRYVVNGFFMYILGTIIYMIFPSTTTPLDFVNGTVQRLSFDSAFQDVVREFSDKAGALTVPPQDVVLNAFKGMFDPAQTLPANAWFRDTLIQLAHSSDNIWGSFPSYHNYWASIFIFFGLRKGTRWYFRSLMILLGVLISLSTLLLHQHCVMDVLITYSMTAVFIYIIEKYALAERFESFLNKMFRVA